MEKISHEKMAQVLAEVGPVLRKVAAERDELKEKIASYERRDRAMKVASEMHQKGLNTDQSLDKLAASLADADKQGKLATIEAAVEMVGPDMSTKIATINEQAPSAGVSDLERFLNGAL